MTCGQGPETLAVHCPNCQSEPGKPCHAPSGKVQQMAHGHRVRLAYALAFPDTAFYRAEAERYRARFPDVDVCVIVCAPSRAQVLWWNQWGANLTYDQKAYEAEHGHPDHSIPALPPGDRDEEIVGQPVSELLEQFDKVKVPRK